MDKIKFNIDEKSLFYGMVNDFERGQTATVHTPLNQSKDPNKWHLDILELNRHDLETKIIPKELQKECLRNTTSQAQSKLVSLFEFKNILLDGDRLNTDSSFCMYIKEEISKVIKNRQGEEVLNTHFGRQKLHYPISLSYKRDGFNIDNQKVLKSILKQNGEFAFVVRGFEYSLQNKTLNFLTTIVGPHKIELSKVFKRAKGTGKKLLLNEIDINDYSLIEETYCYGNKVTQSEIEKIFEKANKTRAENGKLGEQIILEQLSHKDGISNLFHTSINYPTSPYDIEYYEGNIKKYIEVKATQGDKKIFNMSSGEIKFMNRYKENYILFLITNVKNNNPNIYMYTCDDINKMKYEHPTTRFYA